MISPFLITRLEDPWLSTVFAGDSSDKGAGVVHTEATKEEIRRESRWSSVCSWPIADVTRTYDIGEEEFWVAPEAEGPISHVADRQDEEEETGYRKEAIFEKRPRVAAFQKRRPPAVGRNWDDPKRWSLTWKNLWRAHEHINIQELRVVAGIARRLSLDKKSWNKKVLVLTDSSTTLGATLKGRSSSYPLLRQCRVIAGVGLALGVRVSVRYVPSERNPSDGPSRGKAIGAAPETKRAHADRL
jgi:hypothetical protein